MLEVCLNALFCKKLIDGRYVFPYISARSRQQRERQYGEVSEWLKEHAGKCVYGNVSGFESPLTAIFEMRACTKVRALFFLYSPQGGMRTPDRGSTTGAASWTDREPASGLPQQGERSESIPPLTAIFKMRACTQVRLFFFIFSAGGAREKPIPKLILLHPLILFAEVVHQRPDGGQQPAP